jgi:hypothetical protein
MTGIKGRSLAWIDGCLDKGGDQRVSFATQRGALGLKERTDEKRMRRQLAGAHLSRLIKAGETPTGGLEAAAPLRIGSVVAAVAFCGRPSAEDGVQPAAGNEGDAAGFLI